jgi:undecaprenyl-diphosphatase
MFMGSRFEKIQKCDVKYFYIINKWDNLFGKFLRIFTHVGSHTFWEIFALIVIIQSFVTKNQMGWMIIRLLAANVISMVIIGLLKLKINRKRPCFALENVIVRTPKRYYKGPSFPSGHTQGFLSNMLLMIYVGLIYFEFIQVLPFIIISMVLSIFMALSRIHVGVHYPSDVIGGLISGIILFFMTLYLAYPLVKPLFDWLGQVF